MATTAIIRERLLGSFELYDDLAAEVPEAALALKLPGLASNRLGEQLWCVVGARESFTRAIEAGAWSGFSCSLTADETRRRDAVADALARSAAELLAAVDRLGAWDDDRTRLVLRLLEHEAAHQGQLIRYVYALRLPIPVRWKERYALS